MEEQSQKASEENAHLAAMGNHVVPFPDDELRLRQKAIKDTANVLRSDVERLPNDLLWLASSLRDRESRASEHILPQKNHVHIVNRSCSLVLMT